MFDVLGPRWRGLTRRHGARPGRAGGGSQDSRICGHGTGEEAPDKSGGRGGGEVAVPVPQSGSCCFCTSVGELPLLYISRGVAVSVPQSGSCRSCTSVGELLFLYLSRGVVSVPQSGRCCSCPSVWKVLFLYLIAGVVASVPQRGSCCCSLYLSGRPSTAFLGVQRSLAEPSVSLVVLV
eukprot:jgi/Botrbrau1/14443/Bobra.0014s0088.1